MVSRLILFFGCLVLFNGCALLQEEGSGTAQNTNHFLTAYDYQILSRDFQPISLSELVDSLEDSDVVFFGEYHKNHASHLLEMQVFAALHNQHAKNNRSSVLSMEMFSLDQQAMLDDYLSGKIGESYLVKKAPAWDNYKGSYRPLVEYAKQQAIPVVAANASSDIVRCIGSSGSEYIDKLDDEEKEHIARQPFAKVPGYEEKFLGVMEGSGHMPSKKMRRTYLAQLARDNTMAESIVGALKQLQNSQVVHLNGAFHSRDGLGTVGALKRINPNLKIKVITPVRLDELEELKQQSEGIDDFYYLVNPQPEEYVNDDARAEAYREMFKKSKEKAKSCK